MRSTHHFYSGLLLLTPKENKRISKKHTEIFLEFFVFLRKVKQEQEKLFTQESSQQAKEEKKIFLVFLKLDRHTKRKREKENKLAWMIQWQSVNTDEQSESISKNVKSVRTHTGLYESLALRFKR